MNRFKYAASTCLYLGHSPVAPGTFGTLGGVVIAFGLAHTSYFLLGVVVVAGLIYAVSRDLGDWAERESAGKDPGFFVLDEVIGYLITVAWIAPPSFLTLVVAFLVFRFFDVLKPPPVRWFERLGGGDGILLDDVMAGLYGLAVMALLRGFVLEPGAWVLGGLG
ncbi:MAG: phosphatidylglycerophosphatase A [Planctomycetota bacterium]